MYVKVKNETAESYNLSQLRRDNPQTSFPENIPEETLNEYDVFRVKETAYPDIDGKTHRLILSFGLVDGVWEQVWSVEELPLDTAESNVRAYRNRLLSETDWVVAVSYEKNQPVPQEWVDYRNHLRDVPQQVGFPYSVDWGTKP